MKLRFSRTKSVEEETRSAIHGKKWGKAIALYEKEIKSNERNYALWNLLGDLHFNNRAKPQAIESWRRALDGYSMEGLHENALGIARKILRRTPEEEDVYLLIAEAYLGLEYHADCLAAFRSYLKLAKHRSESDMRSLFKKIIDSSLTQPHLLQELQSLYKDSQIEDIELEKVLNDYVEAHSVRTAPEKQEIEEQSAPLSERDSDPVPTAATNAGSGDGLMVLDGVESGEPDYGSGTIGQITFSGHDEPPRQEYPSSYEIPEHNELEELPSGEGKDHYDLGVVYREMRLWDAAIAEFEQARRDSAIRTRASLAMAECLQETNDLQSALKLLEEECGDESALPQEKLNLHFQLGVIHETLGNLQEAINWFESVQKENPDYGDVGERLQAVQAKLSGNQ